MMANTNIPSPTLNDQVKSLSLVFKRNLGTFLSRVQQQANSENGSTDIEGLLTDLDRVISNQKELSELIQKVKLHQKISKDLEITNENIKTTQNSILSLIDSLQKKDLDLSRQFLQAQKLKLKLKALDSILDNPENAILASINLSITTGAPADWNPALPLITSKPPYPTEDLIRRSELYRLMTQQSSSKNDQSSSNVLEDKSIVPETESKKPAIPVRSRRKGTSVDQAKLLNLDLNTE